MTEDVNRLRKECKTSQVKCTELQQQYDLEVSNSQKWKTEKERLETKIISLKATYESSSAARLEQESQIGSHISQLRILLESAGVQCDKLQKAHLETSTLKIETRVEESIHVEQQTVVRSASVQLDGNQARGKPQSK